MKGASGSVEHDLAFQGFGLLLKHLMGKAPSSRSRPRHRPDGVRAHCSRSATAPASH
jgi:hypothetical protein